MSRAALQLLAADLVLGVHFALVAFVIGGLVLIVAGNLRGWRWVNARWFRVLHLGAIAFIAAEAWLGIACPLTTFEIWLREQAGSAIYGETFVQHWLQRVVYYDAPPWVFVAAYSAFCLLVVAVWWRFPPARRRGD